MPMVEIDVMGMVIEEGEHAKALAESIGGHFSLLPGDLRVLLRICPMEGFALNGMEAPPGGTAMVTVTTYEKPDKVERGTHAMRIADIISRELGMPRENVIIRFAKGKGRIAYGGVMYVPPRGPSDEEE